MAIPFKLYLSYTGFYPITTARDPITLLPIPTNLVWTEITPTQNLKNNLKLSTGIDKDVSDIAIRTKCSGDFTLFGADYDLLVNSLDVLNLNELVIRLDRWNGSSYDEYWRGTVEIRGSLDDNRKIVKLSKFTTIDVYTDFLRYRKTNTVTSLSNGSGLDVKMEVEDGGTIEQSIYGQFEFGTNFQDTSLSQYSRTMEPAPAFIDYDSQLFPTFYLFHGLSDDAVNGRKLLFGTSGMAVDFINKTTDAEITLSHQKVFDVYDKLFDGSWFLGQEDHGQPTPGNTFIFLRRKRDTFNNNVVHSFINESKDFKQFKYILPKLVTQQVHMFSKKNIDISHADASYIFNVNGDLEQKISESVVFTDLQKIYDANKQSKEDDWINDSDWVFGLGNQQVDGVSAWLYKDGNTQLGFTSNLDMSLAFRMANDINDFHQLDSAFYNNADRILNPNFAEPAIEQVPFPINTTDIESLDFYGITETSLGDMRMVEASVGFNDIKSMVKCVQ